MARLPDFGPWPHTWGGLPAFAPAGYVMYFSLPTLASVAAARRVRIGKNLSAPTRLLLAGLLAGIIWSLIFDHLATHAGFYRFAWSISGLTLWPGTIHQTPLTIRHAFNIVSIQMRRGPLINASFSRIPRHNEFVHDSWPVGPVDDWSVGGLETQGQHPHDWLKHPSQKRTGLFKPAQPERDRSLGAKTFRHRQVVLSSRLLGERERFSTLSARAARPNGGTTPTTPPADPDNTHVFALTLNFSWFGHHLLLREKCWASE